MGKVLVEVANPKIQISILFLFFITVKRLNFLPLRQSVGVPRLEYVVDAVEQVRDSREYPRPVAVELRGGDDGVAVHRALGEAAGEEEGAVKLCHLMRNSFVVRKNTLAPLRTCLKVTIYKKPKLY